jgi:hypothetical protein
VIAASAPRSDRSLLIGAIAVAALLGSVAVLEYFSNAKLRASLETASLAAQTANDALGQLRTEVAELRVSLNRSGRRGDDAAPLHDVRESLAGLQRRLGEIEATHGSALERLGRRLDADGSQQAEASQKLAGLADRVSRLESRMTAVASDALASTKQASSPAQKQNDRPPSVDGWRVVEIAGRRAIVRNPSGLLYEITTGSEVPGLGTVETVKRSGKRVTVVTPRGIITAVLEGGR